MSDAGTTTGSGGPRRSTVQSAAPAAGSRAAGSSPGAPPTRELASRAGETSVENPWPLRLLSTNIASYIAKMSALWVEGQLVQVNRRPGAGMAFLTLRDVDVDMSLSVAVREQVLRAMPIELASGARVVVRAKPTFWSKRGSLQLEATEIRPVGIGELLAQLEHRKQLFASEGLFDADRKRPLPFLPTVIGLICGRNSAAEHDVVVNAERRWPGVRFAIRQVAVQGDRAAGEVTAALGELDRDPQVDVIIISRGGGSIEDLLPFSNETLVRAAAAARTPIVSAIGHEVDAPLLDLVADVRASTPTDAAKRVVPDLLAEREGIAHHLGRLRLHVRARVDREIEGLAQLRSRPALAQPALVLTPRREELDRARSTMRHYVRSRLERADDQIGHLAAQVRSLSPASTLERGYAIVQTAEGSIAHGSDDLTVGADVRLRFATTSAEARITHKGPAPSAERSGDGHDAEPNGPAVDPKLPPDDPETELKQPQNGPLRRPRQNTRPTTR